MRNPRMVFLVSWFVSLVLFLSIPIKQVHPELIEYYKNFMDVVKTECPKIEPPRQLILEVGVLGDENIGVCYYYTVKRNIVVDKFYWETATEQQRKQLMYHELSHCVLNKDHVQSEADYMNPYATDISDEELIRQVKENAVSFCNEQR